jgi:hypothetical protein
MAAGAQCHPFYSPIRAPPPSTLTACTHRPQVARHHRPPSTPSPRRFWARLSSPSTSLGELRLLVHHVVDWAAPHPPLSVALPQEPSEPAAIHRSPFAAIKRRRHLCPSLSPQHTVSLQYHKPFPAPPSCHTQASGEDRRVIWPPPHQRQARHYATPGSRAR